MAVVGRGSPTTMKVHGRIRFIQAKQGLRSSRHSAAASKGTRRHPTGIGGGGGKLVNEARSAASRTGGVVTVASTERERNERSDRWPATWWFATRFGTFRNGRLGTMLTCRSASRPA